ncbi:MAG: F0F1 ATP synthase subunit A [Deltaproteobacteria bacterium]|nr:F0F1 ATP synthase subunit A [Deltaproteobacteria bacterium]
MSSMFALSGGFTWLGSVVSEYLHFPHGQEVRFAHSVLVMVVILIVAVLARMSLKGVPEGRDGLIPEANLRPRNLLELYTESMYNMVRGLLSKEDSQRFFPLIAGIFLYIFVSNIMGVIPGFSPPTDHVNTNLGMALLVFLTYNYYGIKRQGIGGYIKHMMGPVLALAPLLLLIEIIGHIVRPLSLSIRLYGNMSGDHLVLDIFMNRLPEFVSAIMGWGIPVIFLGLGIFVSLIQAYVFSLLSLVYIALAVDVPDDHH